MTSEMVWTCRIISPMCTRLYILLSILLVACAPAVTNRTYIGVSSASSSSHNSETEALSSPISRAAERITKKPFGIHITPSSSPVQPERFSGYHTGTDFETFSEEQESRIQISAICNGTVRFRGWMKGYGGVLIQNCTVQDQPVTVLYGHLNIDSISQNIGSSLTAGSVIGQLGKGFSQETDGERKHLHLGVHRGTAVNYRGYVQTKEELNAWIDPTELLTPHPS